MAEGTIFVLVAGFLTIGLFYMFGIETVDPRLIITMLALALIPGLYAAITSAPFVPSSRKRHKTMLALADLKSDDVVYDLGCGDGRLVFESAKHVKKSIGYELSIPLVLFGKLRRFLSRSKADIRFGNMWKQNYQDADVIFCYLLPNAIKRFHQDIWPTLKPGTRVVSNAFQMHDVSPIKKEGKVYLYRAV